MKYIAGFAVIAFASLSGLSPCLASNQLTAQTSEQSFTDQSYSREEKNSQIFGEFGTFNKVANRAERQQRAADRKAAAEERRAAYAKRREAMAAEAEKRREARAAEAEKQRQYFESLSPEEQKIYLAKKREANEAALQFFVNILNSGSPTNGDDNARQQQDEYDRRHDRRIYEDRERAIQERKVYCADRACF
ncbi:hypothetical protein B9G53_17050 [Pseudanabaena sp. SR411]|uniref:hypothetical protein n=1 Tax=Pseudanabaena sp. SR411 TaxID=1980935 RepID=UPI000B99371C|nr:hypothetical protein [Pseudanabaena sp. SR411]OYQ63431.1 hypothetical protein B9G53_17050 [Pseudanabaena sp. SR411]